jgi:hypothetical protein
VALGDSGSGRMGRRSMRMVTVAVSAEMVYQLVGSNMSSPQTAELNAGARAPTIKKWVDLTNAEAGAWILLLTVMDGTLWPVIGGGLALAGMVLKYKYAINCGLKNGAPPTEHYGTPSHGTTSFKGRART